MSKYTIELREVLELGYKPFNFDYPIFDENKRGEIEDLVLRFYQFREISEETIERWLYKFQTRVLDVIEVYNKKWTANALTIDPLSNNKGSSKSRTVFNDTPDSRLTNDVTVDFATTITDNEIESDGYTGVSGTDMLNNYLDGLRDINHEFIDEFADLFIKIY